MPVIVAASPTHCFDAAYDACKIALEHMTPVVLLTDGFVANGSGAWKLPDLANYPAINPPYVTPEMKDNYTPYKRTPKQVSVIGHCRDKEVYAYFGRLGKRQ